MFQSGAGAAFFFAEKNRTVMKRIKIQEYAKSGK
jgi:hypothetical protein